MSSYFRNLGRVWHKLPNGEQILLNDITKFAVFREQYQKNSQLFILYVIKDGDRPEVLSKRLYETRNYWWTILLFNNIYDVDTQWPLNESQLQEYIHITYPNNDSIDVHHYVDASGLVADLRALKTVSGIADDALVVLRFSLTPVSIQEYEMGINDAKRQIRLIDPDIIGQVDVDLQRGFTNGG